MRKKIIFIGILSALLIAAVCTLPKPSRINERMTGAVITKEGETIRDVRFIVDGWKLDYLFKNDKIKVNISFSIDGRKPLLHHAQTYGPLFYSPPSYYLTSYGSYQTNGYFAIAANYDCCILTNVSRSGDYMIGSSAPDYDTDAILSFFEEMLP